MAAKVPTVTVASRNGGEEVRQRDLSAGDDPWKQAADWINVSLAAWNGHPQGFASLRLDAWTDPPTFRIKVVAERYRKP